METKIHTIDGYLIISMNGANCYVGLTAQRFIKLLRNKSYLDSIYIVGKYLKNNF